MDRRELVAALRQANVDESDYAVQGVSTRAPLADGGLVLGQDDDGTWAVGVEQRGQYTLRQRFDTEDEACRYLYEFFTRPQPEPLRRTPEEEAAAQERARRQEQEHEREYLRRLAARGVFLPGKPPPTD